MLREALKLLKSSQLKMLTDETRASSDKQADSMLPVAQAFLLTLLQHLLSNIKYSYRTFAASGVARTDHSYILFSVSRVIEPSISQVVSCCSW